MMQGEQFLSLRLQWGGPWGAQALAPMMERGGCGDGKKDLKVKASEGMQIPVGVGARVIIPGIPV